MIVQQLFPEEQVVAALESVQQLNKDLSGQALAVSLLDHLCKENGDCLERVLSALIDRTKFAYVPLEYYDIDRQIAPMLPDHLTLGRLFVPFDLVSSTMMVACCNPFDAAGRAGLPFVLTATDLEPNALPPGLTKEELTAKIAPMTGARHDKGVAGIVGLFTHPGK